jgi:hypothetical protein
MEAILVNLGSLRPSPPLATAKQAEDSKEAGAPLLELHTGTGVVYVCPSPWQRIRLQWAFRHFRELPFQVLSRWDQRLIERLFQSAVVTPPARVARTTVLGVVENVHPKPPASAARVVTMQPQPASAKSVRPMPWTPAWTPTLLSPDFSQRSKEREMKQLFGTAKSRDVRDVPFRQWGALAALSVACVTVILASIYGILPRPQTAAVNHAPALPAPVQASNSVKPRAAVTPVHLEPAALTPTVKPKHQPAPTQPALPHNELDSLEKSTDRPATVTIAKAPRVPAPITVPATIVEQPRITAASTVVPLFVSELPQGHFAHPVVSQPNLVGELQLKALIGADGLVKKVTVLSGDPKLAEAGMRAVRQWHYTPYEVLGNPVEVETHIKMNFFGEDAVSVASIAKGVPTEPRVASVPSAHDQPLASKAND